MLKTYLTTTFAYTDEFQEVLINVYLMPVCVASGYPQNSLGVMLLLKFGKLYIGTVYHFV